jgi:LPS-assembly protein
MALTSSSRRHSFCGCARLAEAAFATHSAAAAPPAAGADARMVVEAKELVYDEKSNTVTARGAVQIYYKGRLLEADRVTYDRNTSRVFAEGHATLTETDVNRQGRTFRLHGRFQERPSTACTTPSTTRISPQAR